MNNTLRKNALTLAQISALVIGLELAVFYIHLGYFVLFVWIIGAPFALLLTKKRWKEAKKSSLAILAILGLYFGVWVVTWKLFLGRRSPEVHAMKWSVSSSQDESKDAQRVSVSFHFKTHPGHFIEIDSVQLRDYLNQEGKDSVDVRFEVIRDFGCMRGFSWTHVGKLSSWDSAGSRAGSDGSEASPWSNPWWCP